MRPRREDVDALAPPSETHGERVERLARLRRRRGWIFSPPTPPRSLGWLAAQLPQRTRATA